MPERFTRHDSCPICGGFSNLPQGQGRRCYGWYDERHEYARCTREEHAGRLQQNSDGTYSHKLQGECLCGETHQPAPPAHHQRTPGGARELRRRSWTILDFGGVAVAEHRRVEYVDGTKRFEWWQNGRRGLNGTGSRDLIYGAELLGKKPELVVLAEGEKAADALREVGVVALATVCGAATTPTVDVLGRLLKGGRQVVLWPDADEDGRRHMSRIAGLLEQAGAAPGQVRLVAWPEAPEKGDAADCAADRRKALVQAATPYKSAQIAATDGSGGLSTAERYGLGYRAIYASKLELQLTRIRESREGLAGELLVRWRQGPETARHVYQGRFNLLSGTTRGTLAKYLAARTSDAGIDWIDTLERFCYDVVADIRRPTGRTLVGGRPRREAEYLLRPILPYEKPTIIFGPGGTGKSTLAAAIAVSVKTGYEVIKGWVPMSAPVLVLDWESGEDDWNDLVDQVAAGAGLREVQVEYWPQSRPLVEVVEPVSQAVTEIGAGLLIVDSVGLASGSSREGGDANESALALFNAVREIGITTLLIDHVTGEDMKSDRPVSKPYGGIYKVNMARSVFELRREKEPEGDVAEVLLVHTKVNRGKKLPAAGLRYEYTDDSIHIRPTDIEADELVRTLPLPERMMRLLRKGAQTTQSLAETLEVTPARIRAVMSKYPEKFMRLEGHRVGLRGLHDDL